MKSSDESVLAALKQADISKHAEGQRSRRMSILDSKRREDQCPKCKEHEENIVRMQAEIQELIEKVRSSCEFVFFNENVCEAFASSV